MAISAEDRSRLVQLARGAVEACVRRQGCPDPGPLTGILAEERGCFVTLTNAGRLRGCIGTFTPRGPLGEMIVEMGQAAAQDPRFIYHAPIIAEELGQIDVEVSVLSPLAETDKPEGLRVGVDGIYVVGERGSGCYLPEVATDQGWDAEEFLAHCCAEKAGLPADAWKHPPTKVYLFTSEKFSG